MKENKKIRDFVMTALPALSLAAFFAIWFLIAWMTGNTIPSPPQVAERFFRLLEHPIAKISIWGHILTSLLRVLKALFYAILFGIPFGLMLGWNENFRAFFKPLFEIIRPIPPIAWIPLITMWFGIGEASKTAIIFLGTFTPIVVNTYTGVDMVPKLNTDAGKIFGAKSGQILIDIVLPSSFPAIFAGIRTALSCGWVVMLAAEMISAKSGLGFLVIRGSDSNDLALTMVAMVFIGTIGAVLTILFNKLERWLCPWVEKSN